MTSEREPVSTRVENSLPARFKISFCVAPLYLANALLDDVDLGMAYRAVRFAVRDQAREVQADD